MRARYRIISTSCHFLPSIFIFNITYKFVSDYWSFSYHCAPLEFRNKCLKLRNVCIVDSQPQCNYKNQLYGKRNHWKIGSNQNRLPNGKVRYSTDFITKRSTTADHLINIKNKEENFVRSIRFKHLKLLMLIFHDIIIPIHHDIVIDTVISSL